MTLTNATIFQLPDALPISAGDYLEVDQASVPTRSSGKVTVAQLINAPVGTAQQFRFADGSFATLPKLFYSSRYSTLSAADADATTGGGLLVIDQNWILQNTQVLNSDILPSGGIIALGSNNLTLNGTVYGDTRLFDDSGGGVVTFSVPQSIFAAWWGMDTAAADNVGAIQAAVNAASGLTQFDQTSRHGYVQNVILPEGLYNTSNITLKPAVRIRSENRLSGYFAAFASTTLQAVAGSTGFLVDTNNAIHNDGCGVESISFVGTSALTSLGGVRLQNTLRGVISYCGAFYFSDEGFYTTSNSVACTITDSTTFQCLLNRTRGAATGTLHIEGSDHFVQRGEYTDSASIEGNVSSSSLYCAAVYVGGTTCFLTNVVGEISDVGFNIAGSQNIIVGCRADQNYGHGWLISGGALFTACRSLTNGKGAANTYDGFHVTADNSQFTGCFDNQAGGGGGSTRYSFFDSQASDSNKNEYVGCRGIGFSTAEFSFDAFSGALSSPRFSAFVTLTANSTTPTINANSSWRTANTGATAYTDFLGGYSGQTLIIQCQDTNSTLTNSGNIRTFTGATETMVNNRLYFFFNYNGKWWELGFNAKMADVGALTISAGTPSTTITDVGGAFNQTTLNNNFATVGTQINAIRTALRNAGLMT